MKIAKIKKVCQEERMCIIYNSASGKQWIGTQTAMYPTDGLLLERQTIPTLFDMPDAKNRMEIGEMEMEMCPLMPIDGEAEIQLDEWPELQMGMPIFAWGEKIYTLLDHQGRIFFVRENKVKPAIKGNEYMKFRLAVDAWGQPLVVIGDGMMVNGIVKPNNITEAQAMTEMLQKMGRCMPSGTEKGQKNELEEEEQIGMEEE